jgi:brefeldin A-inhibited guanine nucleotide-exchange protein
MLIKISLEKLLSECVPSQKYKELREVISKCLEQITDSSKAKEVPVSSGETSKEPYIRLIQDESTLTFYWVPFKLALSNPNSSPKLRECALDMIHKLIAFKLFRGESISFQNPVVKANFDVIVSPHSTTDNFTKEYDASPRFMDDVIISICALYSPKLDDSLQLQIIKVLLTAVSFPQNRIHGPSLLQTVQVIFRIYLNGSHHRVNQLTAKASLNQIVNAVYSRLEGLKEQDENEAQACMHDAEYLFKYLCYVTLTPEMDNDPNSGFSILGRSIAYELILSLLFQTSYLIKNEPHFIHLIKNDLVLSLTKTGTSTYPILFELSLSVFLLLLNYFHEHLKLEVEVLFNEIYLRILGSPNSTYQQKAMVLHGLTKMCGNYNYLLDLFVNYDCDLSMESIYERMITLVGENLAHDKIQFSNDDPDNALSRKLKTSSLCCILATLESLQKFAESEREKSDQKSALERSTVQDNGSTAPPSVENSQTTSTINSSITSPDSSALPAVSVVVNNHAYTNTFDIQESKERKKIYLQGIEMFNRKPKAGVNYLIEQGFITNVPESIAHFLIKTPTLNKTSLGELLGEGEPYYVKIMHAFVDEMDFAGQEFVSALREFLQLFRLPGESQKIDRIMEKFADRYFESNKSSNSTSIFSNADTLYTLAYSIIMLNTDQHNKQIKHKMTKEQFIRNNRGINNNGDLPEDFLGKVFDEIAKNEIVLKDEQLLHINDLPSYDKDEVYDLEVAQMKAKTEARIKGPKANVIPFKRPRSLEIVRVMFKLHEQMLVKFLESALAYFADTQEMVHENLDLEDNRNEASIYNQEHKFDKKGAIKFKVHKYAVNIPQSIFQGFYFCLRISCFFQLDIRKEFFKTLFEKTRIIKTSNHVKNIYSLQTLIHIANTTGNELDEIDWYTVLSSISYLESLDLLNDKALEEDVGDEDNNIMSFFRRKKNNATNKEGLIKELALQNNVVAIDRIYNNTVSLNGNSIVCFFKALNRVSLEEVETQRMFSLQKIVEITYYNMNRIRLEWTQIWRVLQPFFNVLGTHKNLKVATFSVDSLRQLSMKLLEREELANFHTQNDFLKSFEYVMKASTDASIQELVITSLSQIVLLKGKLLKSGWKSVFVVFGKCSVCSEKLSSMAFNFIRNVIVKEYLDFITLAYVDFIHCLIEFSLNSTTETVILESLDLLESFALRVSEEFKTEARRERKDSKPKLDMKEGVKNDIVKNDILKNDILKNDILKNDILKNDIVKNDILKNDIVKNDGGISMSISQLSLRGDVTEDSFFLILFPLITGFIRIMCDHESSNIRTKCYESLLKIFKTYSGSLTPDYWRTIHRSCFIPMLEDNHYDQPIWTLLVKLLLHLLVLISKYDEGEEKKHSGSSCFNLSQVHLELQLGFLDQILLSLNKQKEPFLQSGLVCLYKFISHFKTSEFLDWKYLIAVLGRLNELTIPKELLEFEEKAEDVENVMSLEATTMPLSEVVRVEKVQVSGLPAMEQLTCSYEQVEPKFKRAMFQCSAHLLLLQLFRDVFTDEFLKSVPEEYVDQFSKILIESFQFAHSFNNNLSLRNNLWKLKFFPELERIVLIKQETQALSLLVIILCRLCQWERVYTVCKYIVTRYLDFIGNSELNAKDISSFSGVIITVYHELSQVVKIASDVKIGENNMLNVFFTFAVKMVSIENGEVRGALQEYMTKYVQLNEGGGGI